MTKSLETRGYLNESLARIDDTLKSQYATWRLLSFVDPAQGPETQVRGPEAFNAE